MFAHFEDTKRMPSIEKLPELAEYSSIPEKSLDLVVCIPLYNEETPAIIRLLWSVFLGSDTTYKKGCVFIVNNKPDAPIAVQESNKRMLTFLRQIVDHNVDNLEPPDDMPADAWEHFKGAVRSGVAVSVLDAATGVHAFAGNNVGYARDRVTKGALKYVKSPECVIASTDGDCYYADGLLDESIAFMQEHTECDVLVPPIECDVSSVSQTEALAVLWSGYQDIIHRVAYKPKKDTTPSTGGGFTFMRAKAFSATSGYPHLAHGEDSALEHILRIQGARVFSTAEAGVKGYVVTSARVSDRTHPERSFGGNARPYIDGTLTTHPNLFFLNTMNLALEAADMYWREYKDKLVGRDAFEHRFSSFLRKSLRLSDKNIRIVLATIFDTENSLGHDASRLPTLSGNRFFVTELYDALLQDDNMLSERDVITQNLDRRYATMDEEVRASLQKAFRSVVKYTKKEETSPFGFNFENFLKDVQYPYSPNTFFAFIAKTTPDFPVRLDVARNVLPVLHKRVLSLCESANTFEELRQGITEIGIASVHGYYYLCACSDEDQRARDYYETMYGFFGALIRHRT